MRVLVGSIEKLNEAVVLMTGRCGCYVLFLLQPWKGWQSIMMSMSVCLYVCVCVCLSVCPQAYPQNYMSDLYPVFVLVTNGHGSVTWQCCNTLSAFGVLDGIIHFNLVITRQLGTMVQAALY